MQPRDRIRAALARDLAKRGRPALVAYITAGYPEPREFLNVLRAVSSACDAVEIGVPFSDPMADGVTIQRSSQHAIERGVSLTWIFDELERRDFELTAPVLLMSYLNPLLAFGFDALGARAAEVGVGGFIVPDLPYEESAPFKAALEPHGLALVQMVTPATPPERAQAALRREPGLRVRRDAHRRHGRRRPAAGDGAVSRRRQGSLEPARMRGVRRAARRASGADRRARRRRHRRLGARRGSRARRGSGGILAIALHLSP